MKILFVTSEYAGWIKTGGLGDVSAALPDALNELGLNLRVLVPGYRPVLAAIGECPVAATLEPWQGFPRARLLDARTPRGMPAWVLDCPGYYDRDAGPYQDAEGRDFADNAMRFGMLAYAAARIAQGVVGAWRPEVVHGNDWQAALAPSYLKRVFACPVRCVQTVHNLAFQGLYGAEALATLGLPAEGFTAQGYEFYGRLSFLKAGLCDADAITTVSPTYAREIQRAPLGFGLEGVLASRADSLAGILNGIDLAEWNPETDARIARRYGPDTLERKIANKRALQRQLGLEPRDDAVLLGLVSRLTGQKGIDLVIEAAPRLLARPVQLAVLGGGEREIERALVDLAAASRARVAVRIGFDETLAHAIEAGADLFLMPSRFEPCGLNQMYSQRYGTPPVVRRTGGLADTVIDCTPESLERGEATGFVFEEESAAALAAAVERALDLFGESARWRALQQNGMRRDFGWGAAAHRYAELYERLIRP
ncbi:MAG: glycogen synthase GlgA [Betaproteobacteria bacterium]|nr:glycogen synthase GlgA [Betaproteobacteria bacterium]